LMENIFKFVVLKEWFEFYSYLDQKSTEWFC
jgi:hypothetical protein